MSFRTPAHAAINRSFHTPPCLGYLPDTDDRRRRQKPSTLKFGASPAVPAQASLASYRIPIFDQGQTGSCVGHGTAMGVATSANAAGAPLGFVPSPGLAYKLARVLERTSNSIPLADGGSMPTDVLTVLLNWGIKPIGPMAPDGRNSDVWGPNDQNNGALPNVDTEPTLNELEDSGLCLLAGEYRIDETATNAVGQIQAAVSSGFSVGVGIFVDTAFMSWDPSTGPIRSVNLQDPQGGGHFPVVDYYYTMADGTVVVGGPNSWSTNWPGVGGAVPSPLWTPGCWEMTAPCFMSVLSDALIFQVRRIGS